MGQTLDECRRMQILNPRILQDMRSNRPLKLNLGCGNSTIEGFYSLDVVGGAEIDILADLNEPLDLLPDNSVAKIYSRHAFEHVRELISLVEELYRVLAPDGTVEVIVPHFSNVYSFSDPTHVRYFGLYTMYYFVPQEYQPAIRKVPTHYSDAQFLMESTTIQFYRRTYLDKVMAPILERWVNQSFGRADYYERRLCHIFHAWQIQYNMRPLK